MKQNLITVAYVDDHIAVRKGIIACLKDEKTIEVIIEGDDGIDLLNKLQAANRLPKVCLIDINMPRMNGFQLLKEIKKHWPDMGCLILTVFENDSYIIEMIKYGANGYLLKSCKPAEIAEAIISVAESGYYYSEIASKKTYNIVRNNRFKDLELNEREIKLLEYACTELCYADIATEMGVSFKSLDGVRERLFIKLNINSRIGLAMASIQLGYTTLQTIEVKTKVQD